MDHITIFAPLDQLRVTHSIGSLNGLVFRPHVLITRLCYPSAQVSIPISMDAILSSGLTGSMDLVLPSD